MMLGATLPERIRDLERSGTPPHLATGLFNSIKERGAHRLRAPRRA